MYTTSSPSVLSVCICLNVRGIRVCRVNSYQMSHTVLLYLVFYILPAWGRFLFAELTNKINALFRRLKRFGYTSCNNTVSDLIEISGPDLFHKLCSSEHSLHYLLPPERKYSNLRNRGHPYELLTCIKSLLLFNHCICTFDFSSHLLSFNHDFAPC